MKVTHRNSKKNKYICRACLPHQVTVAPRCVWPSHATPATTRPKEWKKMSTNPNNLLYCECTERPQEYFARSQWFVIVLSLSSQTFVPFLRYGRLQPLDMYICVDIIVKTEFLIRVHWNDSNVRVSYAHSYLPSGKRTKMLFFKSMQILTQNGKNWK